MSLTLLTIYRPDGTLKSHDSRFYVSRLDPDKVQDCDLQCLIRNHWQVGCVPRVGKSRGVPLHFRFFNTTEF